VFCTVPNKPRSIQGEVYPLRQGPYPRVASFPPVSDSTSGQGELPRSMGNREDQNPPNFASLLAIPYTNTDPGTRRPAFRESRTPCSERLTCNNLQPLHPSPFYYASIRIAMRLRKTYSTLLPKSTPLPRTPGPSLSTPRNMSGESRRRPLVDPTKPAVLFCHGTIPAAGTSVHISRSPSS